MQAITPQSEQVTQDAAPKEHQHLDEFDVIELVRLLQEPMRSISRCVSKGQLRNFCRKLLAENTVQAKIIQNFNAKRAALVDPNLTPAQADELVRQRLIAMGWTPPAATEQVAEEVADIEQGVKCPETMLSVLDHMPVEAGEYRVYLGGNQFPSIHEVHYDGDRFVWCEDAITHWEPITQEGTAA